MAVESEGAEAVAWMLPEEVVYWAAIRLLSEISVAELKDVSVGEIRFMDAIRVYYNKHGIEDARVRHYKTK